VESWTSQVEKLTGVLRKDALGRNLRELLPADLCDQLQASRDDGGVQNIYQYVFRPKEATLNIAAAPLISREGERIGRLIILDDVTDRAELERRLMQADKLSSIGLLAAGVAHEVNTPLAVISTYAQMLAKQISGDEQKAPLLEKIARQTFRASEIVNSLLNFSRTSPTEFVPVDLNKVVRETLTLVEHQLAKSSVKAVLELDESIALIKGSPGKLQQVFLNLFLNARDAIESAAASGGSLTIETSRWNGTVRVSVRDTGTGIAPENLARIFDPFFTTKGALKGTGLGLSVSYGIVREHGGDIEVFSQPGSGTQFLLTFPVSSAGKFVPPAKWEPAATTPAIAAPAAAISVPAPIRTDTPSVPTPVIARSPYTIGRTTELGVAFGTERSERIEGGAGPVRPDRLIL
jgi:PAS domain S-box-containing protein